MTSFNHECLSLFANYFKWIDAQISTRLLRRVPPFEVTLTDELLAKLDDEACDREYPRIGEWLRTGFAGIKKKYENTAGISEIPLFNFSVKSFDHSRGFESKFSKVDIGLHIEFGEPGDIAYQSDVYLLQAKKIEHRPLDDGTPTFGLHSEFKSFRSEQHAAMLHYEKTYNLDLFRYMYYMPNRSIIESIERNNLKKSTIFKSLDMGGIWTGRVMESMDATPASIYASYKKHSLPLSAVFLGHIAKAMGENKFAAHILGEAGTTMLHSTRSSEINNLVLALVSGKKDRIAEVQKQLGIGNIAYAPVPNAVLRLNLPAAFAPRPSVKLGVGIAQSPRA